MIVRVRAWAGDSRRNCAALIRIHLGESSCDATMITGRRISVNWLTLRRPKSNRTVFWDELQGLSCCKSPSLESNKRPELGIATGRCSDDCLERL